MGDSLILVQNMRVNLQFEIAIAMFCDKMALQVKKCYGCATHDCIIIYEIMCNIYSNCFVWSVPNNLAI